MDLGFTLFELAAIFATMVVAYTIFGLTGFGSALIASPVLALFMPVAKIVPLLAIVDLFAAVTNVARHSKNADLSELKRLVPMMIIGSLIGATILLKTRPDILLLALGIFVILYAFYSLSRRKPQGKFKSAVAVPFGLVGGVFSALFGSGGFIYAIYLSGRIESKDNLRITQTTLIGLSTLTRVILFTLAGVYMDFSILLMVLLFAPGMLVGLTLANRISLGINREQLIKLINILLLFSGLVLLGRYFSH
ncbi:sulfite exporter TauE/SafE family protein [Yersinia nurmii]|uniref:Probable membrane transporter protein n=1 Tax=Yersinia nurmii TaxID=685706 RepID=A0AAW7K8X7_9GAMM|nr:sulfite exporter TauE/SafE family protein [Yersinia nurmii]MDN0087796.1 sulfite exporter TauE/SafE family protein [Yersinia nurmii]CNE82221.1 Sulfite exporter TauE/SafE [Yersinia nurmii]